MPRRRCSPVVRLAGGRVLVAGGSGWDPKTLNTPAVRSAEIYDPGTNRWTYTTPMHHRGAGAGVLLKSGQVLMTGGWTSRTGAWAEIYHPRTRIWHVTGAPASQDSVLVRLRGGDVLAIGSWDAHPTRCVERYRTRRHVWTPAGRYPWHCPGSSPSMLMRNGHVMVVDGRRVHVYNPATNHWQSLPNLPLPPRPSGPPWSWPQAIVVVHGQPMVIASGAGCSPSQARTVGSLWRPRRHAWQRWTTLPDGADGIAVATLRDGSILLAGGVRWYRSCPIGGDHIPSRLAYRYYPDR